MERPDIFTYLEDFYRPCPHFDSVEGKCVACLTRRRDIRCPECYMYINPYGLTHDMEKWVIHMQCVCITGQMIRSQIAQEEKRRVLEESFNRRLAEGRVTAGDLNARAPKAISTEDTSLAGKRESVRATVHRLHKERKAILKSLREKDKAIMEWQKNLDDLDQRLSANQRCS